MKQKIDLDSWNRKEHFELFLGFEEPYHGVMFQVEMSRLYEQAKDLGHSVFLHYLYRTVQAAQSVENFRLRIEEDEVFLYERLHAGSTMGRSDHTFGFGTIEFDDDIGVFVARGRKEMERVEQTPGLARDPNTLRQDVIHCSPLPWIPFTGLSHARAFYRKDSVPKISFGKYEWKGSELWMPMAVHVHHALVDGYHVGLFYEKLQELMRHEAMS